MVKLTYIIGFYRCIHMLPRQLENWESYPKEIKERLKIILVDDCSPEPPVIPLNYDMNLDVYRILENIPYNNEGAKNLGAAMACTEWILFGDMDYIMTPEAMAKVFELDFSDPETYYVFRAQSTRKGKPFSRYPKAVPLIHKETFFNVHGYYEDFRGNLGKAANQLPPKLADVGVKQVILEEPHWVQFMPKESPDVQYEGKKDSWPNDRSINNKLFEEKMSGKSPWNKQIWRYPWEKVGSWSIS